MKLNLSSYNKILAQNCITEKELLKICGISRSTLSRAKKGTAKSMPMTIGKIAKALNVNVVEIIED